METVEFSAKLQCLQRAAFVCGQVGGGFGCKLGSHLQVQLIPLYLYRHCVGSGEIAQEIASSHKKLMASSIFV